MLNKTEVESEIIRAAEAISTGFALLQNLTVEELVQVTPGFWDFYPFNLGVDEASKLVREWVEDMRGKKHDNSNG